MVLDNGESVLVPHACCWNFVSGIEKGVIINPLSPIVVNYPSEESLGYTSVGWHFLGEEIANLSIHWLQGSFVCSALDVMQFIWDKEFCELMLIYFWFQFLDLL